MNIQGSFVTEVNENDVLLGRGSRIINNEGNIRFRNLIQKRKEEYSKAEKRARKDYIAREVIESIKSLNGRFLRNIESENELLKHQVPYGASVKDLWVLVDEESVVIKVKQAFRNCEVSYIPNDDTKCIPKNRSTSDTSSNNPLSKNIQGISILNIQQTETSREVEQQQEQSWGQKRTNSFPRETSDQKAEINLKTDEIEKAKFQRVEEEVYRHRFYRPEGNETDTKEEKRRKSSLPAKINDSPETHATKRIDKEAIYATVKYPRMATDINSIRQLSRVEIMKNITQHSFSGRRNNSLQVAPSGILGLTGHQRRFTLPSKQNMRQTNLENIYKQNSLFTPSHSSLTQRYAQQQIIEREVNLFGQDQKPPFNPKKNEKTSQCKFNSVEQQVRSDIIAELQKQQRKNSLAYEGCIPKSVVVDVGSRGLATAKSWQLPIPRFSATEQHGLQRARQNKNSLDEFVAKKTKRIRASPFPLVSHPITESNPKFVSESQKKESEGKCLQRDSFQNELSTGERAIACGKMLRQHVSNQNDLLELTQTEIVIVEVLCSYGLPAWTSKAHLEINTVGCFANVQEESNTTGSKDQLKLRWHGLAKIVAENSRKPQLERNPARLSEYSEGDLFTKDPNEFAKRCIMLIEKIRRQIVKRVDSGESKSGLGMAVPLWMETVLSHWALSLKVADKNGRAIPFSTKDFLTHYPQYKNDKSLVTTAVLNASSCNDIFDQIAMLTRLRTIFSKESKHIIPEAVNNLSVNVDFWKDALNHLGTHTEPYMSRKDMVLLERLLEGGFEGVLSKITAGIPSFTLLSFSKADIQHRANELTRELHFIDLTASIDEILTNRMVTQLKIMNKEFGTNPRKRKAPD